MNVYSVSKINSYISGLVAEDFLLGDVSVKGEVSNCTYHSYGHIYFTIKDEKSALSCIMFRNYRQGLTFRLEEGMEVVARGKISVYEKGGTYSLNAVSIKQEGAGDLFERFQRLKQELLELGMFAEEYKKPIPKYVKTVGVVTAPTGAAIQDIINISSRRNPYVQLILYPAIVQGEYAVPSIIRGIRTLDRMGVDVMIVGRGGGSIEDLWAFNDREVAQAVFDCSVPVISAVGHETDTTIIDYVADLRAPTPSAAAELAIYEYRVFRDRILDTQSRLTKRIGSKAALLRSELKTLDARLRKKSPAGKLFENRTHLAKISDRLDNGMKNKVKDRRNEIRLLASRLEGLSPLLKLQQGFSYTEKDGRTLSSVEDTKPGDAIRVYIRDGMLDATVTGIGEPFYVRKEGD